MTSGAAQASLRARERGLRGAEIASILASRIRNACVSNAPFSNFLPIGPRMYELCPETNIDTPEVESLLDLCFAPGRTALSSYRLRDGVAPVRDLCLVLRGNAGLLVAAIRYWPVCVGGKAALLLGPVAVHPTAQGEGLGGYLIRESLGRAAALGWGRVMLVGDAPYYSRFGFARLDGVEMPPPTNPERVLGLELEAGAWVGVRGRVERALSEAPREGADAGQDPCKAGLDKGCNELGPQTAGPDKESQ